MNSQGYTLFFGKLSKYNTIGNRLIEQDYKLISFYEEDELYFFTKYVASDSWIKLDKMALETLKKVFPKYLEWEAKAIDEKVKIQKDIPDSNINTSVFWKAILDNSWRMGTDLNLTSTFFSQSESRHQLVIETNEILAAFSESDKFKLQLYFDKEQVIELQNAISEQSLADGFAKAKEDLEKLAKSAAAESSFT
ncbi:MAG: hypothetical protein Ta2A_18350 [Treponemataceae bacterium]|nr:MAG: hypothetical protein Ta2A_18350 [Treponemataceae bacterium]